MKIKFKILSGFSLIIAMLIIAGSMSIYEFLRISKSVSSLIEDNYKTIEASRKMIEALEREDSGVLLLVSGQWKEGRKILLSADSLFFASFHIAKNNITEKGEDQYIKRTEESYLKFKAVWEPPIVGTSKENSIDWYFINSHSNFINAKNEIESLMVLNQDSMHKEALELKEQSHRALMPGIVAIVAALVFLVIFNFFISKYYVKPIDHLIRALRNFHSGIKNFDAEISTNDEFKEIEKEIQNLIYKLRKTS